MIRRRAKSSIPNSAGGNIRRLPPRLPAEQFWGLAFVTFLILQVPVLRMPIRFLSTWAHEMGHGLGAIIIGGEFISLQITERFGGLAVSQNAQTPLRAIGIAGGLLGPAILGAMTIVLVRGLNWYRVATGLLTVSLLLTQIWAADGFTRIVLGVAAVAFGLATWKLPNRPLLYLAHIVALAFSLDALTGFGYFFMGGGNVAGQMYRSDTGQMADLLGGPHWLWGGLLLVLSVVITVASVLLSDAWARRRLAKRGPQPRLQGGPIR